MKNPIKVSALDAITCVMNKYSYLYEMERDEVTGKYYIKTDDDEAEYKMEVVLLKVEVTKK